MKESRVDTFTVVKLVLNAAGLTDEDYATHAGLWKSNFSMQRLFNEEQALHYLGDISKAHLYRLVKANKILQVPLGEKMKRYDRGDLDKFIKKQKKSMVEATGKVAQ